MTSINQEPTVYWDPSEVEQAALFLGIQRHFRSGVHTGFFVDAVEVVKFADPESYAAGSEPGDLELQRTQFLIDTYSKLVNSAAEVEIQ